MNFRSVSRSTSTTTLNSRTIQVFQGCMADVNAVSNHNPLCMYIVYHIIHSSDTTWSARAEPVPAEQRVGRRVGPLEPIPAVITTPTKGTIQVSPPLVHAISPIESTPRHSLQPVSEKVVLPPSSPVSPVKSIIQMSADIAAKVQEIRPNYCGQELLFTLRQVRKPSTRVSIKAHSPLVPVRLSSYPTSHCSL